MKTMITGVRPTGSITLANYIGGIKGFVEQQDKYNSLIFIADIHGLTTYVDPKEIRNNILDITAIYMACGGKEIDAIDYFIAKKILRKFDQLSVAVIRDEVDPFVAYLNKRCGKNVMKECIDYLHNLKKSI